MKTAIAYITHIYNEEIEKNLLELKNCTQDFATLYIIYQDGSFQASIPSGIGEFKFSLKELNLMGCSPFGCNITDGNSHLIMLDFFRCHDGYDHYWFIEYDVRFNGNWKDFFSFFKDKCEDFVTAHVCDAPQKPTWPHWNSISLVNLSIKREDRLSSFNPICRLSNRAMDLLEERCHLGDFGHLEVLLPTLFKYYHLQIADFGGTGKYTYVGYPNLFYMDNPQVAGLDRCTHRYRPVYLKEDICLPDNIYHPVK